MELKSLKDTLNAIRTTGFSRVFALAKAHISNFLRVLYRHWLCFSTIAKPILTSSASEYLLFIYIQFPMIFHFIFIMLLVWIKFYSAAAVAAATAPALLLQANDLCATASLTNL